MMKKKVCKACGNEYNPHPKYVDGLCANCTVKSRIMPKFGKARDDLRERLGLERLGK